MRVSSSANRAILWVFGAIISSAITKIALLRLNVVPFNSDEAVVALMARHILAGARPLFFYGQAYLGSLDAWLVALGFAFLGQHVWVIRLVQIMLYSGTIATTAILGVQVFGSTRTGILAAWLIALPAVNVILYTTASLGGYGEALLVGNLILISTFRIGRILDVEKAAFPLEWLFWGLLIGFGWWVFGLTVVYSLPASVYLGFLVIKKQIRGVFPVWIVAGVLIGSSPWWGYALAHGMHALLGELGGSAIAGVEGVSYPLQILKHAANVALLGSTVVLGFRPPWETAWLGLPLIPFVMLIWAAVFIQSTKRLIKGEFPAPAWVIAGISLFLIIAFVFSPFGADPSGRYFLPLSVPLALFASNWILSLKDQIAGLHVRWARWGFIACLIGFHLWGSLQSALRFPPGLTTQFYKITQLDQRYMPELMDFLRNHNELRGYTNYWVTYPLSFLSSEEIIFTPRLPYHTDFRYTSRDIRYSTYDDLVETSSRVAYITSRNPGLDDYIHEQFSHKKLTWDDAWIGDFHIFYNLSAPIRPNEIGLGESMP